MDEALKAADPLTMEPSYIHMALDSVQEREKKLKLSREFRRLQEAEQEQQQQYMLQMQQLKQPMYDQEQHDREASASPNEVSVRFSCHVCGLYSPTVCVCFCGVWCRFYVLGQAANACRFPFSQPTYLSCLASQASFKPSYTGTGWDSDDEPISSSPNPVGQEEGARADTDSRASPDMSPRASPIFSLSPMSGA